MKVILRRFFRLPIIRSSLLSQCACYRIWYGGKWEYWVTYYRDGKIGMWWHQASDVATMLRDPNYARFDPEMAGATRCERVEKWKERSA